MAQIVSYIIAKEILIPLRHLDSPQKVPSKMFFFGIKNTIENLEQNSNFCQTITDRKVKVFSSNSSIKHWYQILSISILKQVVSI